MDRDSLLLRFDDDEDGTGKLLAEVRSRSFAGRGSAWFGISEVEEFAEAIKAYPISDDDRPGLASGFWSSKNRGELDQEHFAITVYPVGRLGQVGVQVRISTELWSGDRPESQAIVRTELRTTYQRLVDFGRQLGLLVRGKTPQAVLEAEEM